jgi:hypothetical protein
VVIADGGFEQFWEGRRARARVLGGFRSNSINSDGEMVFGSSTAGNAAENDKDLWNEILYLDLVCLRLVAPSVGLGLSVVSLKMEYGSAERRKYVQGSRPQPPVSSCSARFLVLDW